MNQGDNNKAQQITEIIKGALMDVIAIAVFKDHPAKDQWIQKIGSMHKNTKPGEKSQKNPLKELLGLHSDKICREKGISEEELLSKGQAIWNCLSDQYQEFYYRIYACKQEEEED